MINWAAEREEPLTPWVRRALLAAEESEGYWEPQAPGGPWASTAAPKNGDDYTQRARDRSVLHGEL